MATSLHTRAFTLTATGALILGLSACGSSENTADAAAAGSASPSTTTSATTSATTSTPAATHSARQAVATPSSSANPVAAAAAQTVPTQPATAPTATPTTQAAPVQQPAAPVATSTAAPVPPTTATAPKTATASTSPAAPKAASASLDVRKFTYTLSGRTMTWQYVTSGKQHLFKDMVDGSTFTNPNSIGAVISFGDGAVTGADAGALTCQPKTGLAPFHDTLPAQDERHTYAKPGTYTVKVSTTFCGDAGPTTKTKSYRVVVK